MMRVEVTQDHIDNGARQDCELCPIALALRDMGYENARVGYRMLELTESEEFSTGVEMREWMHGFDGGCRRMNPAVFELESV